MDVFAERVGGSLGFSLSCSECGGLTLSLETELKKSRVRACPQRASPPLGEAGVNLTLKKCLLQGPLALACDAGSGVLPVTV